MNLHGLNVNNYSATKIKTTPNAMKKTTMILLVAIAMTFSAAAQSLEIFGFSGYTFGDKVNISGGKAKIHDGHTYGGAIAFNFNDAYAIEILYSRQDNKVTAFSSSLNLDVDEPVSTTYILAGSNRLIPLSEQAMLFSGAKLGAVTFRSKEGAFDDITEFAAGISGGIKFAFTQNIGLRLQANLNFPITNVGASLWWNSGGGTSAGVSTYTPIVQFGFTGGLVYRLWSE
jgi:hypothetical protein